MKKQLVNKLSILEIEALLCGCSEWLFANKKMKDAESREIAKAMKRAEAKLIKHLRDNELNGDV